MVAGYRCEDGRVPDPPVEQRGWASLFWIAFNRSASPISLLQADRVLLAVNDAWGRLVGIEPDRAVGRLVDEFVAPGDRGPLEREWQVVLRQGSVHGDRDVLRADGRLVRVQFAAFREAVTDRQLVLWVALEHASSPITIGGDGPGTGERLTPRELQVVSEIAFGKHAPEIAADLFIAPSTVRTHVRKAMAKLGARSQAQLVAMALSSGLLDPDWIAEESRYAPA